MKKTLKLLKNYEEKNNFIFSKFRLEFYSNGNGILFDENCDNIVFKFKTLEELDNFLIEKTEELKSEIFITAKDVQEHFDCTENQAYAVLQLVKEQTDVSDTITQKILLFGNILKLKKKND
jgi:hypothetical protein